LATEQSSQRIPASGALTGNLNCELSEGDV